MNNTEKNFEDLLKTADEVAKIYNKEELNDDEIEKIFDLLNQRESDPSQAFLSNNGIEINENNDPSQNKTETVLVSANPVTGLLNTIPYEQENVTEESIDKLLEMQDEDFRKIEIGENAFNQNIKSMYPDADEEGLKKLLNCVNKYRQGIKFSYFNELPEFVKKEINNYTNYGVIHHQAANNTTKQIKNMLAKELFDTIITNNYSSKAFSDISKFTMSEIQKNKEELNSSANDYNVKLREEYEIGFIKKAEALENSNEEGSKETAEKLRKTSKMFTQSYTYEDMYDAFKNKKIKIKNIQVEKFKRTCQEFNRKYYNNTFQIKDVGMTINILDRVLDKKYDINTIKKFIVVFINYTKNFSPSNIDEHVFMYYFIQHILSLNIDISTNNDFNELIKRNIYKFLDLIIIRDNERKN